MIPSPVATDELAAAMPAVVELIRSVSEKARTKIILPETLLLEELALDSLDMVRVVMLMEDRLGVAIDLDEVADMRAVADVARTFARESRAAA